MQAKLTLRLDSELIERAKSWAKARHISLSRAVAEVFGHLTRDEGRSTLSSWTRQLAVTAKTGKRLPTDEEGRELYIDYLEKKYR